MVHEPALIADALQVLKDDTAAIARSSSSSATPTRPRSTRQPGVTVINGGSIGAGGTGNLTETHEPRASRASSSRSPPAFQPLAADLVSIDPGTGSSSARRERLDPDGQ